MRTTMLFLLATCLFLGCSSDNKKVSVRLKWVKQAQFAGYIVADKKGFYKAAGLDVAIEQAGPDIKSFMTVANGSDQIGIAMPNQIISARSNGVPLTVIAQIMQDSPYRYVLKSKNKIDSLQQLKGKTIGLWLKNDEAEFIAMLKTAGMSLKDMKVIPQEFTVVPFLEDKYILSAVTVYNELNQIKEQGYEGDKLQVLSPKDYNCAFLGDMVFCRQDYLDKNPDTIEKFLVASFKGWKYALSHPDETLDILLKENKELKRDEQKMQLDAVSRLIDSGNTKREGMGYMDQKQYANIEKILRETGQIKGAVNIDQVYNTTVWNKIKKEDKNL